MNQASFNLACPEGPDMTDTDLPRTVPIADGVTPATALAVRETIYDGHHQLTQADMDLVFDVARRAGRDPCREWVDLFCEAVTDYAVHQNEPPGYIPLEKADWLIGKITHS